MKISHEIEQKLKRKTEIDSVTNCWLFKGPLSHGYGRIQINYIDYFVHRLSAALYLDYNLLDDTIQINHKNICPNKNCWNPEHLYLGTQVDNVRDAMIRGTHASISIRVPRSFCKRGHGFTPENTYSRRDGSRMCKACRKIRGQI